MWELKANEYPKIPELGIDKPGAVKLQRVACESQVFSLQDCRYELTQKVEEEEQIWGMKELFDVDSAKLNFFFKYLGGLCLIGI